MLCSSLRFVTIVLDKPPAPKLHHLDMQADM